MTISSRATRLRPFAIALMAACLGVFVVRAYYPHAPLGTPGPDIDQPWWLATQLLEGHDPYAADSVARAFGTRIFYPLTAAVAVLPLAMMPLDLARLVFVGCGAALFGYAIGKHRPFLWPTLFGMPFLVSIRSAQWAPLLTAAMLLPALGWLGAAKPNLGVAMLVGARSRRAAVILILGGMALVALSLVVAGPHWPGKWREALATSTFFKPLLYRPGGFLALLALLCWRDPDARLVLALAVVPLTGLFYDVLPLCLVCQTRKQAAFVAFASHVSWIGAWVPRTAVDMTDLLWKEGCLVLWFGLFPSLLIVLSREPHVARWLASWKPVVGPLSR